MLYCFVLGKEQFTRMIIFASIGHTMMMVSTKGFAQSSLCLLSVGACFCLPRRRAAATFWLRPYRTLVSPRESPDHVCRYLRPNGWCLWVIKTRKTKKKLGHNKHSSTTAPVSSDTTLYISRGVNRSSSIIVVVVWCRRNTVGLKG